MAIIAIDSVAIIICWVVRWSDEDRLSLCYDIRHDSTSGNSDTTCHSNNNINSKECQHIERLHASDNSSVTIV